MNISTQVLLLKPLSCNRGFQPQYYWNLELDKSFVVVASLCIAGLVKSLATTHYIPIAPLPLLMTIKDVYRYGQVFLQDKITCSWQLLSLTEVMASILSTGLRTGNSRPPWDTCLCKMRTWVTETSRTWTLQPLPKLLSPCCLAIIFFRIINRKLYPYSPFPPFSKCPMSLTGRM